ncbi:hypothetical protein ABPG77_006621 [Micractinium sp. CCAP 211/92]
MRACAAVLLAALLVVSACHASEEEQGQARGQPLTLPESASAPARELRLGEKLALDELGPLIVTSSGSLRRIANWADLSEAEREVALRRLSGRNRERLATLEEQQAAAAAVEQAQQADIHQADIKEL